MTTRTAWFAPFTHPTPERLETWFEREASRGWQPQELGDMSAIRLRLLRTNAARVRYVVDPQQSVDEDYRAKHEEAGWEYVGELSSLHVWRRRYQGDRPEALTDGAGRRARNRRVVRVAGAVGALALVGAAVRVALGVADVGGSSADWLLEAGALGLIGLTLATGAVALMRPHRPA